MVRDEDPAPRRDRPHGRRRALGAVVGAGALAVPLPLPGNGIAAARQVPREAPPAAGMVHDVSGAEAVYAADVTALVNRRRTANGCPALTVNVAISTAASTHSQDMGVNGYFAHDTPSGVTPWTRMEQAGYAEPAAENIAEGYLSPEEVVDGWMADAGHRGNILDCSFKATGVGYYDGTAAEGTAATGGGPWWTEDFGYE
jgi:uncharacterized protein YkwD